MISVAATEGSSEGEGAATSVGGTPHRYRSNRTSRLRRLRVGQFFGHFHQQLTSLAALDLVERFSRSAPSRRFAGSRTRFPRRRSAPWSVPRFQGRRRRTRSALRAPRKCAAGGCADPVHALFVFLDLLKGDPDPIRKFSCERRHSSRRERTRRPTSASRPSARLARTCLSTTLACFMIYVFAVCCTSERRSPEYPTSLLLLPRYRETTISPRQGVSEFDFTILLPTIS